MNSEAKTETLAFRLSRADKAILKARASAVAGGQMTVVIERLLKNAMKNWPEAKEAKGAPGRHEPKNA